MTETSFLNALTDLTAEWLIENMMTDVTDAHTRAGLVKRGRLLDDPSETVINLMVRPGGKDNPHVLNSEHRVIDSPIFESGGTIYKRRRFYIQLDLFFDDEPDESEAQRKANVVLSRTERTLAHLPIHDLGMDSFGETPIEVVYLKSHMYQSGGEGTYLFDGYVLFEVLTANEYD